jgi:hypothetical protein
MNRSIAVVIGVVFSQQVILGINMLKQNPIFFAQLKAARGKELLS